MTIPMAGNAKFNFRLLTQLTLDTKPPKTQIQRIKSNRPADQAPSFCKKWNRGYGIAANSQCIIRRQNGLKDESTG